jgi:MFS family permease
METAKADAKSPSSSGLLKGVGPNVLVLGAVSFFTDVASEMIVPVLPIFLITVLGAPMAAVGFIEGVAESTASILRVFAGWIADRTGRRKPLIVLGYTLANLVKPLLALTTAWPQVLVIRFADRFGKGIRGSPRDALIADSTLPDYRGRAFGFHRSLDTAGAAIGPLLAAALLAVGGQDPRLVFWAASVPGLIAVIIVVGLVRDRPIAPSQRAAPSLRWTDLGRPFALFTAVTTLFALGNSSDAFLILRAQDLGVPVPLIPLVYFVFNLVFAILATPAGILSDKVGRRSVLVAGYTVFALVYLGFAVAPSPWIAAALFVAYGAYYAMTEGVGRALITDLVPPTLRATAMGVFATITGLALLPASLIAGALWQYVSPSAPFFYGAAMAGAAALLMPLAVAAKKTPEA